VGGQKTFQSVGKPFDDKKRPYDAGWSQVQGLEARPYYGEENLKS